MIFDEEEKLERENVLRRINVNFSTHILTCCVSPQPLTKFVKSEK